MVFRVRNHRRHQHAYPQSDMCNGRTSSSHLCLSLDIACVSRHHVLLLLLLYGVPLLWNWQRCAQYGALRIAIHYLYSATTIIGLWKFGDEKSRRTLTASVPLFTLIPVIMHMTAREETFLLILFAGILLTIWLM